MKIPRVDKSYRHLKRYQQIDRVFFRYGFTDILNRINIAHRLKIPFYKKAGRSESKLHLSHRFRLALEELGPTFIKLGQLLSTRSFLLPPKIINELSQLQDQVRPEPFESVKTLIESELGPLDKIFTMFEPEPIASASIAQAHRAVLPSGESVIVKVQRPNISRLIEADMDILNNLAILIERHIEESRQYEPVAIVAELRKSMMKEVDFKNEGWHIEQFRKNFAGDHSVYIPRVYWSHCTSKILTLEEIKGTKISNTKKLKELHFDLKKIAQTGTRFILKQIFENGFFHADPHPGNIFITDQGKIALIDFGIMGRLDNKLLGEICDFVIATSHQDVDLIIRAFMKAGAVDPAGDTSSLRYDLADFIHKYYALPLDKLEMKTFISEILEITSRHHIRIPSNLFLLIKTLGTYEDLARKIYPEFNFFSEIRPFLKKIILKRTDPSKLSYELVQSARDLYNLLKMLPYEMEMILKRMRRGLFAIELQHRGLDNFILEMERAFNRLSFSLIIAALIVSSSLIMMLNKGPLLFGFPFLGIVGYIFAGILGIGLLLAILRSGKF
jgi:ubiquinone biosynthesis protein